MIKKSEDGYSAPVSLELHVADEIIGVAKVGPDRIVLNESRSVREGEAKLVIKIGDAVRRRRIILNNSNAAEGTVRYW